MTAQERQNEARQKAEEFQHAVKEKTGKVVQDLKQGMKRVYDQASIVQRHFLEAQKDLLQYQIGLVDAGLKKLDETDEDAAKPKKTKTAASSK